MQKETSVSTGLVKGFDAGSGFGFIGVGRDGPDMFAHRTAIQADGFREFEESQRVEFDIVQGARGPQAEAVRRI